MREELLSPPESSGVGNETGTVLPVLFCACSTSNFIFSSDNRLIDTSKMVKPNTGSAVQTPTSPHWQFLYTTYTEHISQFLYKSRHAPLTGLGANLEISSVSAHNSHFVSTEVPILARRILFFGVVAAAHPSFANSTAKLIQGCNGSFVIQILTYPVQLRHTLQREHQLHLPIKQERARIRAFVINASALGADVVSHFFHEPR